MVPNIEIIVGTYEAFLIGYKLTTKDGEVLFTETFMDKSHCEPIKCLSVYDHWIATGSQDDRIVVYDMRKRYLTQILQIHDSTIHALAFTPDGSHLLSGSGEGKLSVVRVSNWKTDATWQNSQHGVMQIACHPSGKLALSLASDMVLTSWNLMEGSEIHNMNMGVLQDCLTWSLGGDYFTLAGLLTVRIWSTKSTNLIEIRKMPVKPVCIVWVDNEEYLVGLDNGNIMWITINNPHEDVVVHNAHLTRVKSMAIWDGYLVTISSKSGLKVWRIDYERRQLVEIAAKEDIAFRLTCVGILGLDQFGDDYKLNRNPMEENQVPADTTENTNKKMSKQNEGKVIITYEEGEEEIETGQSKAISKTQHKKKSVSAKKRKIM